MWYLRLSGMGIQGEKDKKNRVLKNKEELEGGEPPNPHFLISDET